MKLNLIRINIIMDTVKLQGKITNMKGWSTKILKSQVASEDSLTMKIKMYMMANSKMIKIMDTLEPSHKTANPIKRYTKMEYSKKSFNDFYKYLNISILF